MNFQYLLSTALLLTLGQVCLLGVGCSCYPQKSAQPTKPSCAPTPFKSQNQEERTNERLKGLSQRDQKISQAERHFIEYFTANQEQQRQMRQQILTDAEFVQRLGKDCPGHLPYLAAYLQYLYQARPKPSYSDPWQQAAYDYIISRPNLANELNICQQYRTGSSREFSAVNHIEVGMLSQDRANFLCNLVAKAELLTNLEGKTVADIGGGVGILLSKLAPYVNLQSGGHLICIDIEPKLAELSRFIGNYDPVFNKIDYRLAEPNKSLIPSKNNEVDLICLFDVHNIYDKFSPYNEEQRCLNGQKYLTNLKISLKSNGSILVYDSAELMAPAKTIESITQNAGFTVKNLPIKEANGHYLLHLTKH